MKRQDHLLVPRVQHGVLYAIASTLLGVALFVAGDLAWIEWMLAPRQAKAALCMNALIVAHLLFTGTASLLNHLGPTVWRLTDRPRTLYFFASRPPSWSHWYAAVTVVVTVLGQGADVAHPNALEPTMPGTIHDGALIMLGSTALWSWVVWARKVERIQLTGQTTTPFRYVSGAAVFLSRDQRVDVLQVFGLRESGWDPCIPFAQVDPAAQTPELSGPYRAGAVIEGSTESLRAVTDEPSPKASLELPFCTSHWLRIGLWAAVVGGGAAILHWSGALLSDTGPRWERSPFYYVLAGCLWVGLRNRHSSTDNFDLRAWNWQARRASHRVFVLVGLFLWTTLLLFLGFAEHFDSIGAASQNSLPSSSDRLVSEGLRAFETLTVAIVLWIPFWLDFAEPRVFLRLKNDRLQIRRSGLWLPLTDVVEWLGELRLMTGPSTVTVEPSIWGGGPYMCSDLKTRMMPYLSRWNTVDSVEHEALRANGATPPS